MNPISRSSLAVLLHSALCATLAFAQTPPPPARPMPSDGGFERSSSTDNLWDGVDATGLISGSRGSAKVLLESGSVGERAMPLSVAAADMNGDGLMDIVTADVNGYMRVHFNKGTPTEPKFGMGEIIPIWLPLTPPGMEKDRANLKTYGNRTPLKIGVGPFRSSGANDILIGNYLGEMMFLPNSGSAMAPDFRQPANIDTLLLNTGTAGQYWANLLTPLMFDMNRDGKMDLLVGEGSYSANSIHLLLNSGSSAAPKFDVANRFFLAYGDGREQLTPTLADYNGDGFMDVIVGDRTGELAVFLNPGAGWKPGAEFPFATTISFGGATKIPGPIAVSAGDFNGDGLFDLILGKITGRVALALNQGTAKEPKFALPVEIKSEENMQPLRFKRPSAWAVWQGFTMGNWGGYSDIVNETTDPAARPTEGKSCFKAGNLPSINKIIKPWAFKIEPQKVAPSSPNQQDHVNEGVDPLETAIARGSKTLVLATNTGIRLKQNSSYEISFDIKGTKARNASARFGYSGFKKLGQDKITRGDRGSATVQRNEAREEITETIPTTVGSEWKTITKVFKIGFKDPDLKSLENVSEAGLRIQVELPDADSVVYVDNVKIVEKP